MEKKERESVCVCVWWWVGKNNFARNFILFSRGRTLNLECEQDTIKVQFTAKMGEWDTMCERKKILQSSKWGIASVCIVCVCVCACVCVCVCVCVCSRITNESLKYFRKKTVNKSVNESCIVSLSIFFVELTTISVKVIGFQLDKRFLSWTIFRTVFKVEVLVKYFTTECINLSARKIFIGSKDFLTSRHLK